MKVRNILLSAIAISTIAGPFSGVAMAQTAPATGTYEGFADVFKGINLTCAVKVEVDASTGKVALTLAPPQAECASLAFVANGSVLPPYTKHWYNYTYTPGAAAGGTKGVFSIPSVYVKTITAGDCAGNLAFEWDGTSFEVVGTLPGGGSSPTCYFDGYAS